MIIRKIVHLAILLIVLALIGAVGAHWYLQNKVENLVEEIVNELYPVAIISYEDTYTSLLDSSIGVEQLTINPRAVRDEIKIERIVFQAPSIGFLMDAEEELENGNIPEKMRISFKGVTLSTEGSMARSIDKEATAPSLGARDNAYGCADVEQFGFSELAEMGYDQMSIDLKLSYEYKTPAGELNVSALWSIKEMFELEILSIFEVESHQFKLDKVDRLFDLMSNMNITYRDLGFNRNTIDYCNGKRGDQDYVPAHIEAFKQDLQDQLEIIPSDALVEAYRTFMLESGVIDISTNLQRAINPDYFALYNPKDVILLVRPNIIVNGQPVDIPYDDLLKDSAGDTAPKKKIRAKPETASEQGNKPEFVTVTIPQLSEHIGDMVRVKTKQGTVRTGILVSTSSSRIKVEISHHGGSATYPIYVRNIAHTEVMELPPAGTQ
jgi:hypothetical protein